MVCAQGSVHGTRVAELREVWERICSAQIDEPERLLLLLWWALADGFGQNGRECAVVEAAVFGLFLTRPEWFEGRWLEQAARDVGFSRSEVERFATVLRGGWEPLNESDLSGRTAEIVKVVGVLRLTERDRERRYLESGYAERGFTREAFDRIAAREDAQFARDGAWQPRKVVGRRSVVDAFDRERLRLAQAEERARRESERKERRERQVAEMEAFYGVA